MQHSIQVINIKCHGCANTIKKSLTELGASEVSVDVPTNTVSYEYDGDIATIEVKLLSLGYPKTGTPEAESFIKKAQSYVSCAIGKIS